MMRYRQPHPSEVGSPTDWKVTGSQRLIYRSESSEPHIKPSRAEIWHWEKEPLEHLALKASRACGQELHGTGGNRDPILKVHTDFLVHWVPGQSKVSIGIWVKPNCSSWGPLGKTGVNVACCEGRTLELKLSGIFSSGAFLWRWTFWENLPHPISQLLRSPRANNNPCGITAPPLSKQTT